MALAYRTTVKPMMDRGLAGLGLILLLPLLMGIWAVLRVRLGRDPIFRQQRIGCDGVPFWILKFRTIRNGRPCRLGLFLRETCLDELPQLVNVLRGEMSLVGPRPLSLRDVYRFSQHLPHFSKRHLFKPGLTGVAQLARGWGPASVAEMGERLRWDLTYRATAGEDIGALCRTPWLVATRIRTYLRPSPSWLTPSVKAS